MIKTTMQNPFKMFPITFAAREVLNILIPRALHLKVENNINPPTKPKIILNFLVLFETHAPATAKKTKKKKKKLKKEKKLIFYFT